IFILMLPILLPSAIARFKMLYPLVTKLNDYYGFPDKSLFEKFCMYVIGMLNQKATMIIFTGGGFPILASQLLRDYNVAEVGWLDWLLHIGPPLWIGSLIIIVFVWQFLKKTHPDDDWFQDKKDALALEEGQSERLSPKFWLVVSTFLIMIVTWIITDQDKVPLLLPPMILIVLYALPGINIITNKVIRNYDWENFLLLGSSFSLGMLMSENGTANVLAKELISVVSPDQSLVVKILAIAFFVFLIRLVFVVPSSAMIVIFPIVISYAELVGVNPEKLTFMIIMIIGGVMILPMHSPTTFYAYETGVFTKKEQYIIGAFSSAVIMFISILAAIYYW
ncbi:SLC13 family permease, partial [Virgibacillus sp. DJP39]|uniref:SLC13 family permease n=1 Tax=Virgibacillus sp. DJP39 TaxID=3409790 RepID=UPI003BB7583C